MKLWGKNWTKMELLRHVGDMRQLSGVTPFELLEGSERGVRGAWLRNAAGLEMAVIAERGMGITEVRYRGLPLANLSAVGTPHPAFYDPHGREWLRAWPVGFLTPCGLSQAGAAGMDGAEELGLHGRIFGIPARQVRWGAEWQAENYLIWMEGEVRETAVFGENLSLHRRIWMRLDEPLFTIEDCVTNHGFAPAPLMFLQHINLGFPLLDENARLELGVHSTTPRDADAQAGLADCLRFSAPVAGYREQVFYHDLVPDVGGMVTVRLENPALGMALTLRYARSEYPVFAEWKMVGEGLYVLGLEPANCHVAGRAAERSAGTLEMIAPQQERRFTLEIGLEG
jgi:hypothetical protein